MRTAIPQLSRRARRDGRVDAVVTLRAYGNNQRRHYTCGIWNSVAARSAYFALIEKWEASGRTRLPDDPAPPLRRTAANNAIGELVDQFYQHVRKTCSRPADWKPVLRALNTHAEQLDISEFGPRMLADLRRSMIAHGIQRSANAKRRVALSRQVANRYTRAIVAVFRWGVSQELVSGAQLVELETVRPLKRGETSAPETTRVRPVADAHIEATAQHAPPVLAAMIRLQRLTGMRSGELVLLRAIDIDMSNPHAWAYRPTQHKTQHHGLSRVIYLGPRAQQLIKPLLTADAAAYLFQPAAVVAWRRAQRSAARKTPPTYGNAPGTNRVESPQRPPGDRYTTASYRKAVAYALELAERAARAAAEKSGVTVAADSRLIPKWHPHQLRHALITELRARGVDKQTVAEFVGHHELKMTDHYTDGLRLARQLAEEAG